MKETSANSPTESKASEKNESKRSDKRTPPPYMQNRELSWLAFNERVLNQGLDLSVPLLDRLNFVSIFWSNLQEFFMVRVGSLTDLSLVKAHIVDSKTLMTPKEQLAAIYQRCFELYSLLESTYANVREALLEEGILHLKAQDLNEKQLKFLDGYMKKYTLPVLSPQIVNSLHPFPHLENGELYIVVRLDADEADKEQKRKDKSSKAQGVTLGFIPLPRMCERIIVLPGEGLQFILLEDAIEMYAEEIFSMYHVKHTNIICVTRNADLDANEGLDEDEDYREHMKRILKKRSRLAPVRLESMHPLSPVMEDVLLDRLNLQKHQSFITNVPLDMSYTYSLASLIDEDLKMRLTHQPFTPQWPSSLNRHQRMLDQVQEQDTLMLYPYHSMDPFVQLLREAAWDPSVISIKITLYRLAQQSHLAEALIAAAENGKEVTVLCELRARFDEKNNIDWSQRFEAAGCNVIYGFKDLKVHSKICSITRRTDDGIQRIVQLGTGNYNEKTARLYTDMSFITTDERYVQDAVSFFRNLSLETVSDNYEMLWVAPLQIKTNILQKIDQQIALAQEGKPCGVFFKTNSVTDKDIIEKIVEASQANVPVTIFVRGICCIVPGIPGYTENVTVVSIVGRLLEHSRIFGFGANENLELYLSSADLMTRNMEKRIEIAWPVIGDAQRQQIVNYLLVSLRDTAKLRILLADKTYTPLQALAVPDENGLISPFDSQEYLIKTAGELSALPEKEKAKKKKKKDKKSKKKSSNTLANPPAKADSAVSAIPSDLIDDILPQKAAVGSLFPNIFLADEDNLEDTALESVDNRTTLAAASSENEKHLPLADEQIALPEDGHETLLPTRKLTDFLASSTEPLCEQANTDAEPAADEAIEAELAEVEPDEGVRAEDNPIEEDLPKENLAEEDAVEDNPIEEDLPEENATEESSTIHGKHRKEENKNESLAPISQQETASDTTSEQQPQSITEDSPFESKPEDASSPSQGDAKEDPASEHASKIAEDAPIEGAEDKAENASSKSDLPASFSDIPSEASESDLSPDQAENTAEQQESAVPDAAAEEHSELAEEDSLSENATPIPECDTGESADKAPDEAAFVGGAACDDPWEDDADEDSFWQEGVIDTPDSSKQSDVIRVSDMMSSGIEQNNTAPTANEQEKTQQSETSADSPGAPRELVLQQAENSEKAEAAEAEAAATDAEAPQAEPAATDAAVLQAEAVKDEPAASTAEAPQAEAAEAEADTSQAEVLQAEAAEAEPAATDAEALQTAAEPPLQTENIEAADAGKSAAENDAEPEDSPASKPLHIEESEADAKTDELKEEITEQGLAPTQKKRGFFAWLRSLFGSSKN